METPTSSSIALTEGCNRAHCASRRRLWSEAALCSVVPRSSAIWSLLNHSGVEKLQQVTSWAAVREFGSGRWKEMQSRALATLDTIETKAA